jgi:hypothetical protein
VLWVRSRRVEIYLGETLIGCKGLDGADDRWLDVANVEAAVAQLHEWVSAVQAPVRARVWLGSALARPLILPGDCGARNAEEAKVLASVTAGDVTGQEGDLKVWTARWRAGRPTLCVAIPRSVLVALQTPASAAERCRLRVDSVRPWWNQVLDVVLNRSRLQSRAIGWTLVEPDGLIEGRAERGEVIEVGFEGRKVHDPDWSLLRRRLAIGWDGIDDAQHFAFGRAGVTAETATPFAIGGAGILAIGEAGS